MRQSNICSYTATLCREQFSIAAVICHVFYGHFCFYNVYNFCASWTPCADYSEFREALIHKVRGHFTTLSPIYGPPVKLLFVVFGWNVIFGQRSYILTGCFLVVTPRFIWREIRFIVRFTSFWTQLHGVQNCSLWIVVGWQWREHNGLRRLMALHPLSARCDLFLFETHEILY